MSCATCGTENEANRKFCKECGAPLALVCPSCGTPNTGDSKFCGECGAPITATAPVAPASTPTTPPATERRLVSVLFADLVGFTSLSEHRDAEEVRDLLSRYFDTARTTIERHGGLVEKFIGDAVMAVWGTPVAHEDDAERAVRSALELVDAVAALGRGVGMDLQARAGVLTGEAAATVGDTSQGIVTGDLVNTASRLQSAAEPGTVLVGEATYRSASKGIAFAEAGTFELKGKDEPVRAWRALRVVAELGGEGRTEAIEPPFVGRAEDLRLIKELLHATEREGKARLVSVVGIAGIGKSRLAWEFLKYIDGLSHNVYWHQGRCPAYGDGITFWALGEMVRMRARIAESDDDAETRRKLSGTLDEYVTDTEERRWIEPRLAHLLGLDEAPAGEREELFSAWRTFFERIADRGPTLMIFEDLQWADAGLLDFIESLLEWSRNHPILIVTLARPELADRRPHWGVDQRSFTSLRLEPLDDDAMREMVGGFVHGLPDDGVKRVVARAEGVPLYAVETVRMLADRGVLEAREDAYELVGDIGTLDTIPETLHALIAARLDALPSEDRSLLQDASALGKSFTVEALAAVADVDVAALEPRLRALTKREFLLYEADPRSPERGQYAFLQGLIREVAYGTLARPERRKRHLAVAHHLESLDDDELAGVVAAHYIEAFRTTPGGPDAEALAARARDWLGQAADRAASLGSPEQALTFVEQALEITPAGAERVPLLERAGEAASGAAQGQRAVAYFDEAIELSRRTGDLNAVARVTGRTMRPMTGLGRGAEANERARTTLDELGDRIEEATRARLTQHLAASHNTLGSSAEALILIDRALPVIERLNLDDLMEDALATKGWALYNVGRHREALILGRGALETADHVGTLRDRADARLMMGIFLLEDDPRGALQFSLEGADVARRAGFRPLELTAIGNAVETAVDIGEWSAADAALADMREREQLPLMARQAIEMCAAQLAAYRGDHATALEHLELVGRDLMETDFLQSRTWFERVRSAVSLMAGELDDAFTRGMAAVAAEPAGINTPLAVWGAAHAALWLRDVDKARATRDAMDPLRGRWIEVGRQTIDAGIAALEGRNVDATEAYRLALDAWLAMDLPFDHALCAIDAATLLPSDVMPEDDVRRAREYLEALGAKPLLERLSAVEQPAPDLAGT